MPRGGRISGDSWQQLVTQLDISITTQNLKLHKSGPLSPAFVKCIRKYPGVLVIGHHPLIEEFTIHEMNDPVDLGTFSLIMKYHLLTTKSVGPFVSTLPLR